jgi:phage baseplate assembly protein W
MATQPLYRGFSTFEFEQSKTFKLNDMELVKLDLLNHIFTRRGDRIMMADFGTTIPDLVFEPLDSTTLDVVEDELRLVFDYDPRVELLDLRIIPNFDGNAITASATLFYIELNMVDNFELNIQFEE